jgi:hypothetical protein
VKPVPGGKKKERRNRARAEGENIPLPSSLTQKANAIRGITCARVVGENTNNGGRKGN